MAGEVFRIAALVEHVGDGLGAQVVEGEALVAGFAPLVHQPLPERFEPVRGVGRSGLVVDDEHWLDRAGHGDGAANQAA